MANKDHSITKRIEGPICRDQIDNNSVTNSKVINLKINKNKLALIKLIKMIEADPIEIFKEIIKVITKEITKEEEHLTDQDKIITSIITEAEDLHLKVEASKEEEISIIITITNHNLEIIIIIRLMYLSTSQVVMNLLY